jgi:UPF0716 protein FxsA
MMLRLFLAFTLIPIIELLILIRVGTAIGLLNTIILVIVTALLGTYFARREGLHTIRGIRRSLNEGIMPAGELFDGFVIIIAAVLLITPGLLTDTVGFLLLLRPTREFFKKWLSRRFRDMIDKGHGSVNVRFFS